MSKTVAGFDLALPERDAKIPAYLWLYNSVRAEILEGRLRPGARLPATRDLAQQYGLSRGTIVNAFEQLKSEGYVDGTIGSGTFVSKVLPDDLLKVRRETTARRPAKQRARRRKVSDYAHRVSMLVGYEQRRFRAFRANVPAMDLFPMDVWTQLTTRRLKTLSHDLLLGCEAQGYRPLREALADYLNASRGVNCTAAQVTIVSGMQEALDLAARVFINADDKVGIESPGYVGALATFEAAGAKISALPVDNEGVCIDHAGLRDLRMIYVTPAHQFPLGMTMTLRRRLDLLEWARKNGAMIFEDDYDSEYRYCGRPIPALQGLDCAGQVIFAGSFSKVMFPALRLGYLVVARDLVDYIAAAKSTATSHAALLEQAVLCDFIAQGHFGRHIRRMREVYSERLQFLLSESRTRLRGLLEISEIEAGLQTVGWLSHGITG
ncbi:MAG TPA: PLP-dependent aminotransferase family protein, partial [Terriglobales bacterium]|nr:PLP-dependent aminotransferase family protein [Terriglobales bacterium]